MHRAWYFGVRPIGQALLAVAAVCAAAGCRQIFDVGKFHAEAKAGNSGDGDDGGDRGDGGDRRCMSCLQARCESPLKACLDEPTCNDFWNCRVGCAPGDGTCQNTCRTRAWPWNGGAYRVDQSGDLEACAASSCDAECGVRHVFGTQDCMACVTSNCGDVDLEAHTTDVDVQHLESCDARCVAITVNDARRLAYCNCPGETGASAGAVARWTARQACTALTCGMQCNGSTSFAPDLDCLGTSTFVSAVPSPITYHLVAYGLPAKGDLDNATASACTLSEPDCKITRAGPYPFTFIPESHQPDAGSSNGGGDFAGVVDFNLSFETKFEPFADRMEVRINGFRNLLYEVPRLQQDSLTVWWPVGTLQMLVKEITQFKTDVSTSGGSILAVIVADCEGRALPGVQITANSTSTTNDVRSLTPTYIGADNQTTSIGVAVFDGVPTGSAEVTATYQGRFHSKGRVLIVADGYTLIGLGPSAPPPGDTP
jgi:hypothetical protein